nr:type II toxin-antitoxin system CcdA family antitoxin [Streptomyces sp. NBC_00830]
MNISVPDQLAEQVRARDLPISAICQEALRKAVELNEKKEKTMPDLQAVAERLRQTRDEEEVKQHTEGIELGRVWAKDWATYDELKSVVEAEHFTVGQGEIWHDGSLKDFYKEVEHHFREEYMDAHCEGFVVGAGDVWDAVKELI